jgi:TPP-dependent pyruvate/acetoin dehydrogenase alpha subunit
MKDPMTNKKSPDELIDLYRTMCLIRKVETSLIRLFADGEVPGFIHLSIGQEAIAAGVMAALNSRDTIATTHRGHGHVIAKGIDLDQFFMELLGRANGICQGRSGSMHVADMNIGILGANGIVGAGIPIALGSALAHSVRRTSGVAIPFFGDGAMAEGVLHESLNLAALWKLPMVFVCENNGWSEFSPTSEQFAAKLSNLASAFQIPHTLVDGNDVEAVSLAAKDLVNQARADGPRVLECKTHRVRGHFEGDPQKYRSADELSVGEGIDPLKQAEQKLAQRGVAAKVIARIIDETEKRVAASIERARTDQQPNFAAAIADVYTAGNNGGIRKYG